MTAHPGERALGRQVRNAFLHRAETLVCADGTEQDQSLQLPLYSHNSGDNDITTATLISVNKQTHPTMLQRQDATLQAKKKRIAGVKIDPLTRK